MRHSCLRILHASTFGSRPSVQASIRAARNVLRGSGAFAKVTTSVLTKLVQWPIFFKAESRSNSLLRIKPRASRSCARIFSTSAGNLWAIAICAVVAGFGYGLATPAASQILAKIAKPGRHGIIFSLKQSTVSLGGLIAGLIVPILVVGFGWRAATLVIGLLVIATCAVIHPLRRSQDDRKPSCSTEQHTPWRSLNYVLGHPRLRILALISFTFAAAQNSTNAIFVTYAVEKVEMPLVLAGIAFSTMQTTGMATRVFLGWLTDHFISAVRLLGIIGLLIAITLSIMAFINPAWPTSAIFLFAALAGVFVTGWSGVYLAEIARIVPHDQVAVATGGTVFFSFLGAVVGPSLLSLIIATTDSFSPAFLVMAASAGLVGALVLMTHRRIVTNVPGN